MFEISPERRVETCYVDKEHRAIADLIDAVEIGALHGMLISRINVPFASRGKGVARKLFQRILDDADATGTVLFLEIMPSDGLNYEQLEAWYRRHGFKRSKFGFFVRRPVKL